MSKKKNKYNILMKSKKIQIKKYINNKTIKRKTFTQSFNPLLKILHKGYFIYASKKFNGDDILKYTKEQEKYLKTIEELLSDFDINTDESKLRLELQYEESKDFLSKLIENQVFEEVETASIKKMKAAYERLKSHFELYLQEDIESLISFVRFFLTKIELVLIESENLSSALKIFETINQRGSGLNAMDLVKNLLFSRSLF